MSIVNLVMFCVKSISQMKLNFEIFMFSMHANGNNMLSMMLNMSMSKT